MINVKNILLITGLLRRFEESFEYLEKSESFENYQVIISTWETQVGDNSTLLKKIERNGGNVYCKMENAEPGDKEIST